MGVVTHQPSPAPPPHPGAKPPNPVAHGLREQIGDRPHFSIAMRYESPVIPAKASIQCWHDLTNWTPAFAGVTNSDIYEPHQLAPQEIPFFGGIRGGGGCLPKGPSPRLSPRLSPRPSPTPSPKPRRKYPWGASGQGGKSVRHFAPFFPRVGNRERCVQGQCFWRYISAKTIYLSAASGWRIQGVGPRWP